MSAPMTRDIVAGELEYMVVTACNRILAAALADGVDLKFDRIHTWTPGPYTLKDFECRPGVYRFPLDRFEAIVRDAVLDVLNNCGMPAVEPLS